MPYKAQIQATLGGGGLVLDAPVIITNPDVTPTEGANLLDDPGLENWSSATNLASYTESISGTSSINQETGDVHGGSNAARLAVDASNSLAGIVQNVTIAQYAWFRASAWAYASASSKTARLQISTKQRVFTVPTDAYTQFLYADYTPVLNPNWNYVRQSAASSNLFVDDVEMIPLTNVLTLWNHHVNYGLFTVKYTRTTGTAMGLIINADDPVTPLNYTRLIDKIKHDDATPAIHYLVLEKVTNGVPSVIATYNHTYAPDAPLAICRHEDGTLDIYYNDVLLADGVSATGFEGNYWGVLNTFADNTVSEASADPRTCIME